MAIVFHIPSDHPHVAVVTIDRPRQANALDPHTLRELAAAWRRIEALSAALLWSWDASANAT